MMESPAQPLRQNRFALALARPWTARLIATLGILVMTVGLFVPFAGRDMIVYSDPVSRFTHTWAIGDVVGALVAFLQVRRMSLPLQLGSLVVYAVLTLGGLALIPLLWRALSPRGPSEYVWPTSSGCRC